MFPFRVCLVILRALLKIVAAVLRGLATVAKPAMRFLTYLFLIIAVVSFVADFTPALNGLKDYSSTTLREHLNDFAPTALEAAKNVAIKNVGAWTWNNIAETILGFSTTLLFAILSGLTAFAGRHREKLEVYAN